jgi:hypothetical protein
MLNKMRSNCRDFLTLGKKPRGDLILAIREAYG